MSTKSENDKIIEQDADMLETLYFLANEHDSHDITLIAERFNKLTQVAHTRKHWTGQE